MNKILCCLLLSQELNLINNMTSPFLENLVKWEREHTKGTKYTHPDCNHQCISNCRREGCNCLCGEYHRQLDLDEYNE